MRARLDNPDGGNIVSLVLQRAMESPEALAITESGIAISYAELVNRIGAFADVLRRGGVERGDRVGLLMRDTAMHLIAMLGTAAIGAASVSLDWRGRPAERQRIADSIGLSAIVCDPGLRPPTGVPAIEASSIRDARTGDVSDGWPVADAGELPWRILMSSGTTGAPKGVALTHAGGLAWCQIVEQALGLGTHQRHLTALPMVFTGSFVFNMPQLMLGNTLVVHPPLFETAELAALINAQHIDGAVVVPTILRRMLALARDGEVLFPRLDYLVCLGAPLTAAERLAAARLLTPRFFDNYGASGAGPIAFLSPDDIAIAPDSIGRAAPLREVGIARADGSVAEPGEAGLLRCRGPGVATSTCNPEPDEADEMFRDGWYYPGEIASLDARGFIHVLGRASDIILRAGVSIHPAEIESVLAGHPAVSDVAVAGKPSPEYGEEVVAFVVLNGDATVRDLHETCRRALSAHKAPSEILLLRELPRNTAGKVLKRDLVASLERLRAEVGRQHA